MSDWELTAERVEIGRWSERELRDLEGDCIEASHYLEWARNDTGDLIAFALVRREES